MRQIFMFKRKKIENYPWVYETSGARAPGWRHGRWGGGTPPRQGWSSCGEHDLRPGPPSQPAQDRAECGEAEPAEDQLGRDSVWAGAVRLLPAGGPPHPPAAVPGHAAAAIRGAGAAVGVSVLRPAGDSFPTENAMPTHNGREQDVYSR